MIDLLAQIKWDGTITLGSVLTAISGIVALTATAAAIKSRMDYLSKGQDDVNKELKEITKELAERRHIYEAVASIDARLRALEVRN